jgi:hypothetical protein
MARTAATQESPAKSRPRRAHLSNRNRLEIKNKEDGFVYRIVNDVDDRVSLLQEAGYELVPDAKVGAAGDRRVDNPTALGSSSSISVGKNVKAVVMRIPKEWYDEDQAAKQAEITALEQTMRQEARKKADFGSLEISR